MTSRRAKVVDSESIVELQKQLADDIEFNDEDAVYDYDEILDVYASLLIRALGLKGKRVAEEGLKSVFQVVAERGLVAEDLGREAQDAIADIDALHEMANDYVGRPTLDGTLTEADGHRQRIVDALTKIIDALKAAA